MTEPMPEDGRTQSHLRFSKKLALALIAGVGLLFVMAAGVAVWIADQHDRLARDSAARMIHGGVAALEQKLAGINRDYSTWTDAYEHVLARDVAWIYPNLATSTTENGTVDLMLVIPPGGDVIYGWRPGMGETPAADLVSPKVVAMAMARLDREPLASGDPVTFYARDGGRLWLFAITRVVPWEGLPEGTADADLPRNLFAYEITDELVNRIGRDFLIDDVSVSELVNQSHAHLPLTDANGQIVARLHWTPPTPGGDILRRIAVPLGAVLALFAVVAALVSHYLVQAAQRLERALMAARAADRAKTEFLANVTHELRTPMNGIIGIAQLMEQTGLDTGQAEMLGVLRRSADDQMTLINGLLDVARIEAGRHQLDEAPFEPAFVAGQVLETLAPAAAGKGLELQRDFGPTAGATVLGDTEAFRKIVTNLAGNAVKFTDSGSVRLTLGMTERLDRARLTLVVADTGPGIAPVDQDRIFERFVQLDGSTTRKAGGTGLGLAIVRSLVELMGGEIRVDSTPGKGSRFSVTLDFELVAAGAEQRNAA